LGSSPLPFQQKRQLAEAFLTSLRKKDWGLLRSLLTEDSYWTLPGNNVISGEAIGPGAVVNKAQTIVGFAVSLELLHILYGRHGVGLLIRNRATREGKELDEHLVAVCNLRDGRICGINTYLSDVPMMDTFFPAPYGETGRGGDEKTVPANSV
jgi:ketosteroid isomerase-like protein